MDELLKFGWGASKHGYKWINVEGSRDPNAKQCLAEVSNLVNPPVKRRYSLADEPTLFRIFAATPPTLEGIKVFADEYGVMGDYYYTFLGGKNTETGKEVHGYIEPLYFWLEEIQKMRRVVELWDAVQQIDIPKLSEHIIWQNDFVGYRDEDYGRPLFYLSQIKKNPGEQMQKFLEGFEEGDLLKPALAFIQMAVNAEFDYRNTGIYPLLGLPSKNDTFPLYFAPANLRVALWLQLAQAIAQGRAYKACANDLCGKPFAVSNEKGARKDRLYCSDACKAKVYRARKLEPDTAKHKSEAAAESQIAQITTAELPQSR